MPDTPDVLLVRGYNLEHANTAQNLRLALEDVQRHVARLLTDLDADPASGLYGGATRQMAATAAEAAVRAGELDMANRLTFLLPEPQEG